MGRIFKCALRTVAVIAVAYCAIVYPQEASATHGDWLNTPIVKVNEVPAAQLAYNKTICSGEVYLVSIEGWNGLRESCVYGQPGGMQVSRYQGSSGLYLYAVKFPLDAKFVPLKDVCVNAVNCAYGQEGDTLLLRVQQSTGVSTALVPEFSKRLVKHTDDGTYFSLEYPDTLDYVALGTWPAHTNAIAISPNGRWALVELESFGFVRIDLVTLERKRVVAPGAQYGYGSNPAYELTISNDGARIAIAGWRANISVYEIDRECGDELKSTTTISFSPYVYACQSASIDNYQLFPGFISAHMPRFSRDSVQLSVYVQKGPDMTKATIAPQSHASVGNGVSYTAFGDSFTSGEGELSDVFYLPGTNTQGNRCHVSSRSYPYLMGIALDGVAKNSACSGSRIPQVVEASGLRDLNENIAESPSHISIGVGGNDVDLMGKLKTCLGIGTCEWAKPEKRRISQAEIRSIFSDVVDLLRGFRASYPSAAIALIGYPSVVNTGGDAKCTLVVSSMLNAEERRYLDESVKYLNTVLRAAASYTKVIFVDIEEALNGERLCDSVESAMNSVRLGDDIAPLPLLSAIKIIGAESFHPTPRGHQLITTTFRAAINNTWWSNQECLGCVFSENQLAGGDYWSEFDSGEVPQLRQKSSSFLSNNHIKRGVQQAFSFQAGSFLPGSTVRFELHSHPQELAAYTVNEDGALSGVLTFPPKEDGYHTVHAYGQLPSGEEIDIYETVAIEPDEQPVLGGAELPPQGQARVINTTMKNNNISGDDLNTGHRQAVGVMGDSVRNTLQLPASIPTPLQRAALKNIVPSPYSDLWFLGICVTGGLIVVSGGLFLLRRRNSKNVG